MRYYNYFEVTDAVRAFTGGFDLTALIDVLFEEVPTHPVHVGAPLLSTVVCRRGTAAASLSPTWPLSKHS